MFYDLRFQVVIAAAIALVSKVKQGESNFQGTSPTLASALFSRNATRALEFDENLLLSLFFSLLLLLFHGPLCHSKQEGSHYHIKWTGDLSAEGLSMD